MASLPALRDPCYLAAGSGRAVASQAAMSAMTAGSTCWAGSYSAGEDGPLASVSGELVEQVIARSTADNMDHLNALAADLFEAIQYRLIFQRETLQDAAHERAVDTLLRFLRKTKRTIGRQNFLLRALRSRGAPCRHGLSIIPGRP